MALVRRRASNEQVVLDAGQAEERADSVHFSIDNDGLGGGQGLHLLSLHERPTP